MLGVGHGRSFGELHSELHVYSELGSGFEATTTSRKRHRAQVRLPAPTRVDRVNKLQVLNTSIQSVGFESALAAGVYRRCLQKNRVLRVPYHYGLKGTLIYP